MAKPMDDQLITDYILGVLSKTETERLDELSVSDDDFAEKLVAIENDLVDAYVRDELSGDTLKKFKSHYLTSPRRREKVAFAKTFRDTLDHSLVVQTPAEYELSKPRFFAVANPKLQWIFAAAAVLMLFGAGFLMFENLQLRKEIAQTQAEHSALKQRERELQQKLDQHRTSDTETKNKLARVREQLAQLEQQLEAHGQRPEQEAVKVIAFNLLPQKRGVAKIPTLVVPASTDYVAITLELESNDFTTYNVSLKDPATDKVVWNGDKIKISGSSKQIQFQTPVSLLKPQNYILELSGISADGASEIVSTYPFRVVTQ